MMSGRPSPLTSATRALRVGRRLEQPDAIEYRHRHRWLRGARGHERNDTHGGGPSHDSHRDPISETAAARSRADSAATRATYARLESSRTYAGCRAARAD